MSLNIRYEDDPSSDFSGSTLMFGKKSWTLVAELQCGESWEIFHSNSSGSPSIVSKALYCDELLNNVDVSSQTMFDSAFSLIFPKA